jgi:hypothetical protein
MPAPLRGVDLRPAAPRRKRRYKRTPAKLNVCRSMKDLPPVM